MTHKPSMTCEPSISEVALGCVSGGLFGRHGRSVPRELDFEEPECQERPFRTQLRLNRHSMYVCVLGSDPEAPEEVQGLIGLTPDELNLCQSLDTDLAFIFAWLERGDGAGGGGVLPRQPGSEELSHQPEPVSLG